MADYVDDDFEWDADKSEATPRDRGFDFALSSRLFQQERYLEVLEESRDYGEGRLKSWGPVLGHFITVIWTPRGSRKRIISARLSDPDERDEYAKAFGWNSAWESERE